MRAVNPVLKGVSFYFSYLIIAFSLSFQLAKSTNDLTCGLAERAGNIENTKFFDVEVSEHDANRGDIVKTLTAIGVQEVESNSDYLKLVFHKNNDTVQVLMEQDLRTYRTNYWTPSMETEFRVQCVNGTQKEYAFLLLIADENICSPTFNSPEPYNFSITVPWMENRAINDKTNIEFYDCDYNEVYADVNLRCKGEDCSFIRIGNRRKQDSLKFYWYNVDLYLNVSDNEDPKLRDQIWDTLWEKQALEFSLVATDQYTETEIDVTVHVLELGGVRASVGDGSSPGKKETANMTTVYSIGGVLVAFVVGSVFALMYYKTKHRAVSKELKKLTASDIEEFFNGLKNANEVERTTSFDANTPIFSLPYNTDYEIPRERLKIDETQELGKGAFGIVMKGRVVLENGEEKEVAVKTVKKNVMIMYFKALLSEIKIMAHIGDHSNVIGFLGACTENIRKREVYIAVEYCSNGNLNRYLKLRRNNFKNMVDDGTLMPVKDLNYASQTRERKNSFAATQISTLDLIKWAIQIANGLDYIASKNIVHGDLATRNVLLTENNVVKIADFGLSRRLVDMTSNYQQVRRPSTVRKEPTMFKSKEKLMLPWKWLAIETLKELKFSVKSDVWAFGVVMWELFTLAETPFANMEFGQEFIENVECGLRLQQPKYAPNEIYNIMTKCWKKEWQQRPKILDIKMMLEKVASDVSNENGVSYLSVLEDSGCYSAYRSQSFNNKAIKKDFLTVDMIPQNVNTLTYA